MSLLARAIETLRTHRPSERRARRRRDKAEHVVAALREAGQLKDDRPARDMRADKTRPIIGRGQAQSGAEDVQARTSDDGGRR